MFQNNIIMDFFAYLSIFITLFGILTLYYSFKDKKNEIALLFLSLEFLFIANAALFIGLCFSTNGTIL